MTQDEYSDSPFTIPDGEIHKRLPEPMQTVFLFAVCLELANPRGKSEQCTRVLQTSNSTGNQPEVQTVLSDILLSAPA